MSFSGGHWYPCFGFLVTSPLGFKARVVLPYLHCRGKCNVHFLRSNSGATHCRPLDGQHCGASTRFISCPRILLCGTSESRTRDQQIMSVGTLTKTYMLYIYFWYYTCLPVDGYMSISQVTSHLQLPVTIRGEAPASIIHDFLNLF